MGTADIPDLISSLAQIEPGLIHPSGETITRVLNSIPSVARADRKPEDLLYQAFREARGRLTAAGETDFELLRYSVIYLAEDGGLATELGGLVERQSPFACCPPTVP